MWAVLIGVFFTLCAWYGRMDKTREVTRTEKTLFPYEEGQRIIKDAKPNTWYGSKQTVVYRVSRTMVPFVYKRDTLQLGNVEYFRDVTR